MAEPGGGGELLIVKGPDAGRTLPISGTIVVGRDAGSDVVVADPQVSRRHVRLTVEDGRASVEDLGSSNGTHVNGERLTGPRRLAPGDLVAIGDTELEFVPPPPPAVPADGELRVLEGTAAGTAIPLAPRIVIGREEGCDLVLTDTEVSRRHAELVLDDGHAAIDDLFSTNGTFVNGERVIGRQAIEPGDRIELGGAVLEFSSPRHAATRIRSTAPQVTAVREVVSHAGRLLTADTGARKWWTLLVVCLGTFMLLVDVTIVNVAIPAIAEGLEASFTSLVWVVNAYVLGLAALLLICGTIGDRVGQRNVFGIGLAIFTASSLSCGLAGDSSVLIASRAVQGVGGAMMFATSLALLSQEFSHRDRATAFAVWGAVSGGGVAMGPILGGALTDGIGWRSIFLFNVPIGVVAIVIVLRKLVNLRPEEAAPLDIPGALTLGSGLLLLTLGLATGYSDGWGATHIVAELVASVVLLTLFVIIELTRSRPMLDLTLFRNRSFSGISVAAFALSASVFALLIYITIYLQTITNLSALGTGLTFLPMMFLAFALAAPAGKLSNRIPTRWFMSVGLVLVGAGMLLCRGFGHGLVAGSDWSHLVPGFVVSGIGIGVMTPAMASAALATVGPARAGMASGAFISARQIGTALGVAILGAIFQHSVSVKTPDALGSLADQVSPESLTDAIVNGYTPFFIERTSTSIHPALSHAARDVGGATLNELFVITGVVALVGAVLSFVLIRRDAYPVPPGPPAGGPPGGPPGPPPVGLGH